MKREIGEKWVKALRSGEYRQGHGTLRVFHNESYCCLGVLTVVHNNEVPVSDRVTLNSTVLSPEVAAWAGLSPDVTGTANVGGLRRDKPSLWNLNDGSMGEKTHTFAEIADIIEAEMDEL
jgi:hypothetical protein